MQKYIRTHIVEAEPMTRGEHLKSKGLKLIPGTGSESDEGYFIQYPDGYKAWCPKESFEKSGRPIDGMTFGQAIEALKLGKKVSRRGWNGKGQYLSLGTEFRYRDLAGWQEAVHETSGKAAIVFHGTIGEQVGWLASQSDMLSEDWTIVE